MIVQAGGGRRIDNAVWRAEEALERIETTGRDALREIRADDDPCVAFINVCS